MTIGLALMFTSRLVAAAEENAPAVEANGFYASGGLSRLDVDVSDGTFRNSAGEIIAGSNLGLDFDSVRMISLAAGYNWGRWALELGYEQSLDSGDLKSKRSTQRGDFDYSNFKMAAAFRSAGKLYFLGKVGLSVPEFDTNVSGLDLKLSDSAFIGLGGGYRFSPAWSVELEATRSGDDTLTYTMGMRYKF
jgi:hypothetical protein